MILTLTHCNEAKNICYFISAQNVSDLGKFSTSDFLIRDIQPNKKTKMFPFHFVCFDHFNYSYAVIC